MTNKTGRMDNMNHIVENMFGMNTVPNEPGSSSIGGTSKQISTSLTLCPIQRFYEPPRVEQTLQMRSATNKTVSKKLRLTFLICYEIWGKKSSSSYGHILIPTPSI